MKLYIAAVATLTLALTGCGSHDPISPAKFQAIMVCAGTTVLLSGVMKDADHDRVARSVDGLYTQAADLLAIGDEQYQPIGSNVIDGINRIRVGDPHGVTVLLEVAGDCHDRGLDGNAPE